MTAGAERLAGLLERRPGSSSSCCTGAEIALEEAARLDDADAVAAAPSGTGTICCWRARTSRRASSRAHGERRCSGAGTGSCSRIRSAPRSSRTGPAACATLVAAGALCSITAGALEGHFGPASQWFALELLRDGLVHSLASDAHAAAGRPPGLQAGLDAAARHLPGVVRQTRWLTNAVPAAILAGEPLPARPELVAP